VSSFAPVISLPANSRHTFESPHTKFLTLPVLTNYSKLNLVCGLSNSKNTTARKSISMELNGHLFSVIPSFISYPTRLLRHNMRYRRSPAILQNMVEPSYFFFSGVSTSSSSSLSVCFNVK